GPAALPRGAAGHPVGCPAAPGSAAGLLLHLVGGDEVLELQVVVRAQVDAALVALADLGDIVLVAAQPGDLDVLRDDRSPAGDACLRAALDDAAAHDGAGDVAELGGAEDLADLRRAELDLLVLRLEHALERLLDLVDRVVDDRVVLDLHALAIGVVRVQALGPHVVADDEGVGRHREVDVVHRDRADAAVDDAQIHALADVDAQQRLLQGFHRTGGVALEDEVEGLDLAIGHVLVDVLEADALADLRQRGGALGGLPLLGDLARGALVLGDQEGVTGSGHRGQAQHLDRTGRTRLGDVLAVLVEHGAHSAVAAAADDRVADPQGALLDQHRGDRAAALVEVRLDR